MDLKEALRQSEAANCLVLTVSGPIESGAIVDSGSGFHISKHESDSIGFEEKSRAQIQGVGGGISGRFGIWKGNALGRFQKAISNIIAVKSCIRT